MDSIFLRVAKNPAAFPEAAKTLRRLKSIAAKWNQEADDISDEEAFHTLLAKTWISLQCHRQDHVKVTDISPLSDFPQLTGLCLWNNEIKSISALEGLTQLTRLGLYKNQVQDLTPLHGMKNLRKLEVQENPIRDFSVLANLPSLVDLDISCDQLAAFAPLEELPQLRCLKIMEPVENLRQLPKLPKLRALHLKDACNSLDGVERFTELQNLYVGSGELRDLSPISELVKLTHLNIGYNHVEDLEPLRQLYALRDLWAAKNLISSIEPLLGLPVLHSAVVKENPVSQKQLAALKEHLTPWDTEFASPEKTFSPCAAIEVVDQETWDFYDKNPFGLSVTDDDYDLLYSEKTWLMDRIESAIGVDWKKEQDFWVPDRSPRSRSFTVVLLSEEAVHSLRQIVASIQRELCYARNEFIIYLQSDIADRTHDFAVWVYRDKILATSKTEPIIRKLLGF
jgi:Leucine-rich repeat (LRR) protein